MPKESAASTAMVVLRIVRGWGQSELAAAAGLRPASLSDYERGKKPLSRRTLERLVTVMGYPPSMIARTLAFIEEAQQAAAPIRAGGSIPELVEAAASGFGREVADFIRAGLTRLTADVTLLEARARAPFLWERLRGYGRSQQLAIVRENPEFWSWALCELLCEESVKAAADKPKRAMELSDLALVIAGALPQESGRRSRLQGYAWAFVGNARRVQGDLQGADEAFTRSSELWHAGVPPCSEPLDEARLLDLEASLRRDQRRLHEALALLDRALTLRSGKATARILIKKAKTLEELGSYEEALALLRRAEPLVDADAEPRLLLCLRFNLLDNLFQVGRFAEAVPMSPAVRELAARLGNDLDLVRLRWLEGRLAAGLGHVEEAAEALRLVRAEFASRGIAYDAALVTLELATLLAAEGRSREVRDLARQSAPLFQAQGVHREALAALAFFRQAAEEESLTTEAAREILDFLRVARLNPALRFGPSQGNGSRESADRPPSRRRPSI